MEPDIDEQPGSDARADAASAGGAQVSAASPERSIAPHDADDGGWFGEWTTGRVVGLVVVVAAVVGLAVFVLSEQATRPSEDSVDVGFLQDMTYHHGQAVQIASIAADTATDPDVRDFAQEVLISQQYQVGYMTALLEDWGYDTGDPDREGMAWMGTPGPLETMYGVQPEADVQAFRRLPPGDEANAEYLRMMTAHHLGGIHMARDAARHGDDPRVVDLAERMATAQAAEVREYNALADRLGYSV